MGCDYPWTNSHHLYGETCIPRNRTSRTGLLTGFSLAAAGSASELDRLELIDEYRSLIHPMITGHGPTLYEGLVAGTGRLDLISAEPLRNGAVAVHYRRAD